MDAPDTPTTPAWRPPTDAEVKARIAAQRAAERQRRTEQASPAEPVPLDRALATDAPDTGPVMERPHPASPLVKGWLSLVGLLAITADDWGKGLFTGNLQAGSRGLLIAAGLAAAWLVLTLVYGFFSWRATRFVVDDSELRIEHTLVWHSSDRVPFTKIQGVDVVQPFAARLFGLARLHIDVGSGDGKQIDFLTRQRAHQMRAYLIARARGESLTVAEADARTGEASALRDLTAADEVLLQVGWPRLALAEVISTGHLIGYAFMAAAVVGAGRYGSWIGFVGLAPLLLGLGWSLVKSVVQQWDFRLVRSDGALKISRGLTTLVSQTVPSERIMGLVITQHLTWRPWKLYRVQFEALGAGGGDEGDSDVLLPVGTWADVERAVDAVWPGFRLDTLTRHSSPQRSRWLHPIIWRSLAWAADERVLLAHRGGLVRRTALAHHARAQSVHLRQGPLQRRLRLADVEVDIGPGLLGGLRIADLDAEEARTVVLEEMDRCRAARAEEAARGHEAAVFVLSPQIELEP